MPTIRLENVSKNYRGNRHEAAISNVDLTVTQGEFIFLVGSRGAGKSTLLRILSGAAKPSGGTVYLDEEPLGALSLLRRRRLRELAAGVSQQSALVPGRTVRWNMTPRNPVERLAGGFRKEPLVEKALGLVGMAGAGERRPRELSDAECHRIELAKAIVSSPAILILDEITDKMDDDTIWDLLHLLSELNAHGTTVVMVTNAGRFINIMRKRVITMADGKIVSDVRNGRYDKFGGWRRK